MRRHLAALRDLACGPRAVVRWAPPVVAALAVLVLTGWPLLFDRYYFGFDTTHIDLGMSCELQSLLRQGAPLWLSPSLGNGGQLFGNPGSQLLYPPRLLVLALPVDLGVSLFIVLHLVLAAASTAWLLRTFHVRPGVATCAGIVFAASGTAVDLIQHSYYLPPVAWLPWTWAACRRSFAPSAWRGMPALAGLGVAMCLLGGEPQGAAIALSLVIAESLWRLWRARGARRRVLLRVGMVAACALAGCCAGFGQWPSFLAEAQLGTRGGRLELAQVLYWSFEPTEWLAALLPGRLFSSTAWRALFVDDGAQLKTWNPSPYLGASLVLLWVSGTPRRRARLPALLAMAFLLAALGRHTTFYPTLVSALPPLALFRYPQKYLLMTTLAAVVVAALQVEALRRRSPACRWFVAGALPVLAALLLGLGWTYVEPSILERAWHPWQQELGDFKHLDLVALLRGSLVHALAVLGLATCVAAVMRRPARWLVLLLALDVVVAASATIHVGPSLADLHSPLHHLPSSTPRVLCTHPAFQRVAFPTRASADAPWAQQALLRLSAVPERQACDGMSSAVPYAPGASRVAAAAAFQMEELSPAQARALGCTHLQHLDEDLAQGVERERFDALPSESARRFARGGPPLYRVIDPIPEHFVARQPALATDEDQVLGRMAQASSAALALAIVDDPLQRLPAGTPLPDGAGVSIARVHWPVRSEATIELTGSGGAVVGLRTAFLVGWQAEQAGQALRVVRVSGNHLGVLVEDASRGPLSLRYRSPHLALAVASAVAGGLALIALPWLRRPRRRRRLVTPLSAGP